MRSRTKAISGGLIALALVAGLAAQQPGVHPVSGRRYAPVMGYQGAPWLERGERDEEEAPDVALNVLKIPKGASVADIGAGSGFMTVRLAARVGPTGRVFANDVQPQMLNILARRLSNSKITNVTLIEGTFDDPKLPPASVDLALMVDVYHELSQPQAMLRHLLEALKPGGRLVLLEYRKEDPTVPIKPEHKMSVAEAKMEVEAEGFTLTKVDEALPRQHILIFTAKPSASPQP
ncbi:MAG TPA: methyltransferase domain-containing protein [Vicinamibacterales bacterium]|jgi:SAM-dependent methyltransferase|nr:methyltransferase domain-containing protein [Vicinamibacterales bacterium]